MVAVCEALLHLRVSDQNLWLVALLFLSAWSLTGHARPLTLPEVVIPLKVSGSNRDMTSLGWLSYSLNFGGQRHIVHLKANRMLVSRHLPVFTYTDQGALHEDQPFIQKDCYFHGFVEGEPGSLVALTTCLGGFRGTLQINNTVYEIKPKSLSSTFEHLVSKVDSEETEVPPLRCGLTEEEIARQMKLRERDKSTLMQSSYEGWWTHQSIIEMAVVIDNYLFSHRQSNMSIVQLEVLKIINVLNYFYSPMEAEVVISGLVVWNQANQVKVEEADIETVLDAFRLWKFQNINTRIPHDFAHLFVKYEYGITLGLAYVDVTCNRFSNCGVDSFVSSSLIGQAYIVAHELGHNLGMSHDEKYCVCGLNNCIMAPHETTSTKFSNCSYEQAWNTFMKRSCLRNIPKAENVIKSQVCGNGVVEEGEVCDCGSYGSCSIHPCCQRGCALRSGANCSAGACCKDCLFLPARTVCREKENECDLPEWCNGTSQECPHDVYLQGGSPCNGGYCYEKRCNNREEQCRQIFGQDSRSANHTCYKELNTQGDRFGNCGITRDRYLRCGISDFLCGRIQCENVTEIPHMRDHSTVQWRQVKGITCWSTDYHWGMKIPDVGDVKDGTECGVKHVCLDRKCVYKPYWSSGCTPVTCNGKGVCNNKDHCHCDPGWGPPLCLVSGDGGSVDSGPPPHRKEESKNAYLFLLLLLPFWLFALCFMIGLCLRKPSFIEKDSVKVPAPPEKAQVSAQSLPETGQFSVQSLTDIPHDNQDNIPVLQENHSSSGIS